MKYLLFDNMFLTKRWQYAALHNSEKKLKIFRINTM